MLADLERKGVLALISKSQNLRDCLGELFTKIAPDRSNLHE